MFFFWGYNVLKQIAAELATCLNVEYAVLEQKVENMTQKNILFLNLSQLMLVRFTKVAWKQAVASDSEVMLHFDSMKLVAVGNDMCFWSTRGQGCLLQKP